MQTGGLVHQFFLRSKKNKNRFELGTVLYGDQRSGGLAQAGGGSRRNVSGNVGQRSAL
jgi:hypothetical protein